MEVVASANFMRLSLRKGAHAASSSPTWQEIRVRSGRDDKFIAPERLNCRSLGCARDDKGEGDASIWWDGSNDNCTDVVHSTRNLPQAGHAAPNEQPVLALQLASNVQSRRDDLKIAQDVSPGYSSTRENSPVGTAECVLRVSAVPAGTTQPCKP